jgi:hypothetical protein
MPWRTKVPVDNPGGRRRLQGTAAHVIQRNRLVHRTAAATTGSYRILSIGLRPKVIVPKRPKVIVVCAPK